MLRYMIVFLISFLAPLFLLQRIIPLRRPLDLAPVENRVMECPAPPRQRTEERPWDAETVLAELDAAIRSLSELPPEPPSTVIDEETAALDIDTDGEVRSSDDADRILSRAEVEALLESRRWNSSWEEDGRGDYFMGLVEGEVNELFEHVKRQVSEALQGHEVEEKELRPKRSQKGECVSKEQVDEILLAWREKLKQDEYVIYE
mmetsp:Transcript_21335/g.44513  ORF Transcript_21335/g.44513 Transcript_21335/m.44513 type:complete len:204 (+) Transcript_21335:170-781(+)